MTFNLQNFRPQWMRESKEGQIPGTPLLRHHVRSTLLGLSGSWWLEMDEEKWIVLYVYIYIFTANLKQKAHLPRFQGSQPCQQTETVVSDPLKFFLFHGFVFTTSFPFLPSPRLSPRISTLSDKTQKYWNVVWVSKQPGSWENKLKLFS